MNRLISLGALIAVALAAPTERRSLSSDASQLPFVGYVSNLAEHRSGQYAHTIADIKSITHAVDALIYGQLSLDTETFAITSTNPDDSDNYKTIVALKEENSYLKVIFSVGGPFTPSHTWSTLAATEATRAAFIASAKSMVDDFGFDGIEIDWDYPCSPPKSIWVQLDEVDFREISDLGGNCPDGDSGDVANIVELLKELRTAIGEDAIVLLAAPRVPDSKFESVIPKVSSFVDNFMVKAYGYAVSNNPATKGSSVTLPFQPIKPMSSNVNVGSVTDTIAKYMSLGTADQQIVVVMPAFGSTYYLPSASRDEKWKEWGFEAAISGACYGPYANTHGASPSDATHVCGEMTYQEIIAAISAESAPQLVNDAETESDIAFFPTRTKFVSYTGNVAVGHLVTAVQNAGRIGGIAINSIDMDTLGSETVGDYALTLQVCKAFFGDSAERCRAAVAPTPPPNQPPGTDPSTWCVGDESCTEPNGCTYCVNSSLFVICPNNVTEPCPLGTECKQNSTHGIICDWPEGHYDFTAWKAPVPPPTSRSKVEVAEKRGRRETAHAVPRKSETQKSWFSSFFSY
jgi:GH18 family chitinase